MCGIAGILQTFPRTEAGLPLADGGRVSPAQAMESMLRRLGHRGPDDEGVASVSAEGRALFGHTRLAILDLSPAGHQPMQDPGTGNWITYNGEVYNFREVLAGLKAEGPGLTTRSQTDTEVILKAYARLGHGCLERLRGMFAFGIWDPGKGGLFLARDRLGIKPLYYYAGNGFFLFASEVRALLASGLVPRRLDPETLLHYLAYQSAPAPRTLIQEVRMLLPGHWLTVDRQGKVSEGCYWDILKNASLEAAAASASESRRRVRELLEEAVALHQVSDVPMGAFLSGGIDSSAIVALMRQVGQAPRTFTVAFSEKSFDEARHARQVADRFCAEHTEVHLTEGELLEQLPDSLAALDQPSGDGVNTYVISRAVRGAGIKAALSGLGGDELFGGYPSFARLKRAAGYLRLWGRAPAFLKALAAKSVVVLGGRSPSAAKAAALLQSDGTLAALFPVTRHVLSPFQSRTLLEEPWLRLMDEVQDPYVGMLRDAFAAAPGAGLLARISYAEGRTYMQDVLLRDTDQMSMAHTLEVRVPLLDHRLVEYAMGLPDSHRQPNGTPKRLLVESLDGLLPEEVAQRPKKGFTLPFEPWMRSALRQFCQERLGPGRLGGRGIFRPERLTELWQGFLAGRRESTWSRLWVLVVLEEWLQRNGVEA